MQINSHQGLFKLVLVALCSVFLMSMVPILVKHANASAMTIAIGRLLIALVLMLPLIIYNRKKFHVRKRDWFWLVLCGLVFALHWISYFYSIQLSTASTASIGVSTFGIFLFFIQFLLGKSRFTLLNIFSILACFGGVLIITPEFDLENKVTFGVLLGICAGFFYACLPVIHQQMVSVHTQMRTLGQFLFALLALLPFYSQTNWQLDDKTWWILIFLGVICTVIAHMLWVKASTELPTQLTSVLYYLYVPSAIFLSYISNTEELTFSMVFGAALIIFANILTLLKRRVT